MKNDFPTALKLGGVVLAFIAISKMTGCLEKDPNADESIMAAIQCKDFVQDKLKSPSTAEFQSASSAKIMRPYPDQQKYTVLSYVDAQNSFGAKIRTRFICEVERGSKNSNGYYSWRLIDLMLEN